MTSSKVRADERPLTRPGVIVGLDLIRFAAALMVVLYHLAHRAWAPPVEMASIRKLFPNAPAFPELESIVWVGWVGVEIFFVVSGLVIALSAERASPFGFLRGRVIRLAPALWVCAGVTLIAYAASRGIDGEALKAFVRSLALPAFPFGPWVDSVYWTLVVEIIFYALIHLLLIGNRFDRLEGFMAGLTLWSGLPWVAYGLWGWGGDFMNSNLAELLLLRHGCFFAAGMALWLLLYKRVTLLRLAALSLALTACLLEIDQLASWKEQVFGRDLSNLSVQAVFLAGVAAVVASVKLNGRVSAALRGSASGARTLGLMTYPLYLVHNVVGVAALTWLALLGMNRHVALVLSIAAVVLLAWAISRTGERWLAAGFRTAFSWIERRTAAYARLAWLFRSTRPVPA